MPRTKEEIEQKIAGREAEKRSIIDSFNAEQTRFQQFATQQQQRVTHLEGMIIQLQEDLNEVTPAEEPPPDNT